jgi:DNA mismatch endonuclease (patch repair protein)
VEKVIRRYLPSGEFEGVSADRSKNMSAIRGLDNRSTERRLRAALARAGISGWHLRSNLPGRPDFYAPKERVAIFVDGCFWHGCPKCGHTPKTRSKFWRAKIARNKRRDNDNTRRLEQAEVCVLRFWEHELTERLNECVEAIWRTLRTRVAQTSRRSLSGGTRPSRG